MEKSKVGQKGNMNGLFQMIGTLLRHKAPQAGLSMREDGFVPIAELLSLKELQGVSVDDLVSWIEKDESSRFSVVDGNIRANDGHSLPFVKDELIYKKVEDLENMSEEIVLGTSLNALAKIEIEGLKPLGRKHIVFAKGVKDLQKTTKKTSEALIFLDKGKAASAGLEFFESNAGKLLCSGLGDSKVIPPELFQKIEKQGAAEGASGATEMATRQKIVAQANAGHDKKLSRSLSRVLRHSGISEGLNIGSDGFVQLKELQEKLTRFRRYRLEDFERVVADNDKQRFTMAKDGEGEWIIRANQGHSMQHIKSDELLQKVDIGQIPVCVHGTYKHLWAKILAEGLSPMSRQHVHFAKGLPGEDGVISGMRKSCEILIYLDTKALAQDNLEFFESSNGVLLSSGNTEKHIPAKYFHQVLDRTSGNKVIFRNNDIL